jgi:hypothetical protein
MSSSRGDASALKRRQQGHEQRRAFVRLNARSAFDKARQLHVSQPPERCADSRPVGGHNTGRLMELLLPTVGVRVRRMPSTARSLAFGEIRELESAGRQR